MQSFRALVTEISSDGKASTELQNLPSTFLPTSEVLIKVEYSSLNYKDALSASGHKGITRNFPHIPGIDAAGVVVSDISGAFKPGMRVLVTGFDMGMNAHGGLSEYIAVPANWVVEIPNDLSTRVAMQWGTAGLTAAMAVDALVANQVTSDKGDVFVTGASGGVGMIGIRLLSHLGYSVVALSGKPELAETLKVLGASRVIARQDFAEEPVRALYAMEYAGAIDTLGGDYLVQVVKRLKFGGAVAVCGMASGVELPMQVYPFILRGARMLGIYSADSPLAYKQQLWAKIAEDWSLNLADFCQEITLEQAPSVLSSMLAGTSSGRYLVKI
ncbi:YhdH/YhfP family quinone oxidoreductase [Aquirufa regiilacus]|uniref:YhdH/YhfP family quinone oxidoreductase n=1 Tax=Aquirufa regiilacus TaxID=3024868 RepID=A0ABU3TT26_9BACT|nr:MULTISPECIES: YhdH/YhfP family quinone oxidoreductase [unclassified Aquirufa]MDT8886482.1 YhdH/YhfP family quinone oxidoreductase [Aquirufa sp. LEPPI-3A]MDU0808812.1 YhdH/YhfP family quinone oxidoreductase [Aquirufa sp. LEOWEIH-7C]